MLTQEEVGVMELALLLGIPVYRLMDEMPYDEFQAWFEYLNIRPPGWKEDRRAFLLMSAQGIKASPGELFPSLKQMESNATAESTLATSLKHSSLFTHMLSAVGSHKLEL